jgi:FAD:protein FMN transferase
LKVSTYIQISMRSSFRSAGGSKQEPSPHGHAPIEQALRAETIGRGVCAVRFRALGCPCEVLAQEPSDAAVVLGQAAAREAWRIERKFSRYRDDSVTAMLHRSHGAPTTVDQETAALIDFASHCHASSEGLFDITSGVLRRVWNFDGSDQVPERSAVERLLPLVGFSKLCWQSPVLQLPEGMELDFGGIGKEYAIDRAFALLLALTDAPFLINFGGDLRASGPPSHGPWQVGIERPGVEGQATMLLDLWTGALATSGDSHRFLVKDGVRYGHVLDPRTGYPVIGAPRSVTVAGASCTEAGMWATMALLNGKEAAAFLEKQGRKHWIVD